MWYCIKMKRSNELNFRVIQSSLGIVYMLAVLSGCYHLTIHSAEDHAILLTHIDLDNAHTYRVKRHFYTQRTIDYVFGMNSKQDLLVSQVLSQELEPKTSIINLKVVRYYQALDVMIAFFTLGIYTPARLTIEGDVIESLN